MQRNRHQAEFEEFDAGFVAVIPEFAAREYPEPSAGMHKLLLGPSSELRLGRE